MATSAKAAIGTLMEIGDGSSPPNYTTIAEVRDISGPALSADTADVTSHDSTNDWEEHVVTILRSGEVTFELNYLPGDSTHDSTNGLLSDLEAKTRREFRQTLTDSGSSQIQYTALVVGFEFDFSMDSQNLGDITLKPTGKITLP